MATHKHDTHFQKALEMNVISEFNFVKGEVYQQGTYVTYYFMVSASYLQECNILEIWNHNKRQKTN